MQEIAFTFIIAATLIGSIKFTEPPGKHALRELVDNPVLPVRPNVFRRPGSENLLRTFGHPIVDAYNVNQSLMQQVITAPLENNLPPVRLKRIIRESSIDLSRPVSIDKRHG